MATGNPSSRPRFSRWGAPGSPPPGPYRLAFRLLGIPVIAVAGVLIYNGLRDYLVLPACDSARARTTLASVLKQFQLEPLRYQPITTISAGKDEVVCNARLPLADGAGVNVDYRFFWQGNKANMKYSISRTAPASAPSVPAR